MNMSQAKTGLLWLSNPPYDLEKHKLRAVAYTGMSDPFVVFYNEGSSVWKKPCAVLRLLHECRVQENNDLSFVVTPLGERIGNSPTSLTFTAENDMEKAEWVRIFKDFQKETRGTKNFSERRKSLRCIPKLAAIEEAEENWEQRKRKRSLILA
jgi:hypothetical protein